MALGVLNNLSAIYAENNLNNTNNSLQTVLQQLSSGSRINSGADDAAGLSLVNGLQANSKALTQSSTNATEGVGLLQVADGALSQVTNLLNRAITLATEASNGTLNSSQGAAANQEYQSILAEVNNIGSTTTYNQQAVFSGSTVAIYTGDASLTGSSIDNLYIRTLSAASVGDTGGAMSYSNGQDNLFIDLSRGGNNASVTDSLNGGATGSTTLTVNYLAKGSNGTYSNATANITVGAGSNYTNTAQGLIDAINNSGLGLSASFTTAALAGSAGVSAATGGNASGGSGTDTGILISGIGVGTGTNGAGEIGTLSVNGVNDVLGGGLSIVGADGKSHDITLGTTNSTDTLANLAANINAGGYGVTASVNTSVVNGHAVGTVLTLSSSGASVTVSGTNITDASTAAIPTNAAAYVAGNMTTGSVRPAGSTVATLSVNEAGQRLGGSISLLGTNAAGALNAIAGLSTAGGVITLGVAGVTDSITNLANFINNNQAAGANLLAVVGGGGTTLTIETTATVAAAGASFNATLGAGTVTDTAVPVSLAGIPTPSNIDYSAVIGTLTGTTGSSAYTGGTLNIGAGVSLTLGTTGKTDTLANLAATINGGNFGVTAALNAAQTSLTFTGTNSSETFNVTGATVNPANGWISATTNAGNQNQVGTVTVGGGSWVSTDFLTAGDSFTLNGTTYAVPNAATTTMSGLASYITSLNLGMTASMNNATGTMTLTSTSASTHGISFSANLHDSTHGTAILTATADTPALTNSPYYSVGITGSILDSSTSGGTTTTGMVADTDGNGSIATMSYTDGAGADLSATDLSTQMHAQSALTALNLAIADVAAMDGYLGAQINILNAISQVMSTQQENIVSAQNAIQATDYAAATSNMSKYEILSQTGIAALAQANQVQQEVTKLLQ